MSENAFTMLEPKINDLHILIYNMKKAPANHVITFDRHDLCNPALTLAVKHEGATMTNKAGQAPQGRPFL